MQTIDGLTNIFSLDSAAIICCWCTQPHSQVLDFSQVLSLCFGWSDDPLSTHNFDKPVKKHAKKFSLWFYCCFRYQFTNYRGNHKCIFSRFCSNCLLPVYSTSISSTWYWLAKFYAYVLIDWMIPWTVMILINQLKKHAKNVFLWLNCLPSFLLKSTFHFHASNSVSDLIMRLCCHLYISLIMFAHHLWLGFLLPCQRER